MLHTKVTETARGAALVAALIVSAVAPQAYAGGPFNYRIPLPGSTQSITVEPTAEMPVVVASPPATSYQAYQWPSWFPKTADGYVIDWYTYDNNRDGVLDGTRVGLNIPVQAYAINLSGGPRTVLSVEPLSPGLSFDTSVRDGGNCFEAGQSPAPSAGGNGTACYIYPQYMMQKAGENKVAFKIKHTLGEDIVGMAFYGYEGPSITSTLASATSLGVIPSGDNASITFHAVNAGKGKGKLMDSMNGTWTAATCPGVSLTYNGVELAPGADCEVTVRWPAFYRTAKIRTVDMLGAQVSILTTLSWTN